MNRELGEGGGVGLTIMWPVSGGLLQAASPMAVLERVMSIVNGHVGGPGVGHNSSLLDELQDLLEFLLTLGVKLIGP